jgi:hypothetical protein
MPCTLSRTFVCLIVTAAAALAGCGDDDSGTPPDRTEPFNPTELKDAGRSGTLRESACGLLRPREVARLAARPDLRLRPTRNDSHDLSICDWRDGGLRVQLVIDAAPSAQLRFYNQLAEQLQFHNPDPEYRPRQIKGVGDDGTYGGAGAWWTRATKQLVAYKAKRILKIRVVDESIGDRARRRTAVRVGRASFARLSAPASSGAPRSR